MHWCEGPAASPVAEGPERRCVPSLHVFGVFCKVYIVALFECTYIFENIIHTILHFGIFPIISVKQTPSDLAHCYSFP